ncbi:MAG: hypothetical protein FRX48_01072 [Lasallia pustulata]|uniref:Indole-diterpene biosynthesis protein PaxU n=1 Tax=Lasallia pustulata TaxID=136370 RepID=A0A5M8Q3U2_9LECA|nr:MAG: hypothetical protein FRX48_01072 [Lasallia pustulata]
MAALSAEFINIGPRTSLYTPRQPISGQLVIMCTWLGAARKHVAKYTALWQKTAPGARILLVESAVPILISSYKKQRIAIKPAVYAIQDTLAECGYPAVSNGKAANGHLADSDAGSGSAIPSTMTASRTLPKVLLHTFSNGGTNTATQLLIVLHERLRSPLPLIGLILDSCPAKGTYWKSYDPMILALPKNAVYRAFGAVVVHCILIMLYSWIAIGNENPASLQRRTLLDENRLNTAWEEANGEGAAAGGRGRACYIYSREDPMVEWTDIRDHAADARKKGWLVEEILFDGSGHCAHLSKDEERYVMAMRGMWNGTRREEWTKRGNSRL